jgi:hypothetical protein
MNLELASLSLFVIVVISSLVLVLESEFAVGLVPVRIRRDE